MRKWLKAIFILALLAIAIWTVCLVVAPGQPHYAGKPVSYWFQEFYESGQWGNMDDGRHLEAATALQRLGTNALPYLLDQALTVRRDTPLRRKLNQLTRRLPRWFPRFSSYEARGESAFEAMREMKPPASMVLPRLTRALTQTNTPAWLHAIYAMGFIGDGGEAAVPFLISATGQTNRIGRQLAIQALQFLGPKSAAAVPRLTELLQSKEMRSTFQDRSVAYALGAIGSNAAPALPALQAGFAEQTNNVGRQAYALALCQIDAHQDQALAFLVSRLKNESALHEQQFGAFDLGRVGPNARTAVPDLMEMLDHKKMEVSMAAVDALQKIGVPREELLPKMEPNLQSPDETVRVNFASRILLVDQGHPDARKVLVSLIRNDSIFASYAAIALQRAGPAAKAALPELRQLLPTAKKENRNALERAIRSMEQ